jgi:arsenite-transporting ATPase
MERPAEPGFLQDKGLRLLLFGGKGGVGKTTCAAAAALHLAQQRPQDSFLLVSTDPAHSLLDCFAGMPAPKNLVLREIDPQQSLEHFKTRHEEHLSTIALRGTFLDQTDVANLVKLSVPGLDEIMALLEIEASVKASRYACIIVDTAPAGHMLRLLGLPSQMRKWIAALDAMLAKYRYLTQLYQGSYQKDAVDLYLEETLSNLKRLWTLLHSAKRCRFVPVMLAEGLSIHVTQIMLRELERLRLPVREIVVNRLLTAPADCPLCSDGATRQALAVTELLQVFPDYSFWGLPAAGNEVQGPAQLLALWPLASPLTATSANGRAATPDHTPQTTAPQTVRVLDAPGLPQASITLLLFAGKGGVGKTTLACASALRLAQEQRAGKTLLFSIDPAHSLAACLGHAVGPQETQVAPGLSVIELDAQAEYAQLKKNYSAELTGAFGRSGAQAGIELAFDRDVLERMLDVAPPGLDEMLALTRIVDLMDRRQYDLFILDTAPTGHLLRFLEMPELMEKWLSTFFALFLKYRDIFWLPKITQMMVDLSKKMKTFRRLLTDASQAALVAVTIPTEMAYAETLDLVTACQRLGVAVPVLFVNLVTPPSSCPNCTAARRAQQALLLRYHATHAQCHLTQVFRQKEPRGIERLNALGQALYRSSDSGQLQAS